jgi:hypothetical protein
LCRKIESVSKDRADRHRERENRYGERERRLNKMRAEEEADDGRGKAELVMELRMQ